MVRAKFARVILSLSTQKRSWGTHTLRVAFVTLVADQAVAGCGHRFFMSFEPPSSSWIRWSTLIFTFSSSPKFAMSVGFRIHDYSFGEAALNGLKATVPE